MQENNIIGIGEILWDIFPERKIPGGAPANFAYHASQFGSKGCVISAIGKDLLGKEMLEIFAKKGLSLLVEMVDYPTGTVNVKLDSKGVPQYEICENVAWDYIPLTEQAKKMAQSCQAFCFGTLAQRNEISRKTILSLLDLVPKNAYKIFDVNLRQNFYSKEIIQQSLQRCNILKINEEEFAKIEPLLKACNLDMIVLTKGEAGSHIFAKSESSCLDTPKVNAIDTVGAGDSFIGTLIGALLQGKSIREAHKLAVDVSSYVCTQYGPMP